MNEISDYTIAILIGVAVFGAVLGLMHLLQVRRSRFALGIVRNMEGKATAFSKSEGLDKTFREDEDLTSSGSLYGISYLAWILTSLIIPAAFFLFFFENLVVPYPVPDVNTQAWFSYRSPAGFEFEGQRFERHQLLAAKGSLVGPRERRIIEEALDKRVRVRGQLVGGILMLLVIFFFILLYHMNILYPNSTEKNKNLILIYLTVLLVLVAAKLALFYNLFSPYLIPVPWAGMAITIFINRRIVPLTMLISVIFLSVVSTFDFRIFLVLLAGGLVSGTWVRRARRRSEVILASLLVGSVMALVFLLSSMIQGDNLSGLFPEIASSMSNGLLSGLLLLVTLPFLEKLFDFTSSFRLMELLDLNTPLLKEFFFKAPGTYQHSMVVANIAEMVASEIGANDLLVRVGAYYHDIGKMFNPRYFIENQSGEENPHDSLGPVASAAVVRSHVILGVRLGRQIGLPGPVIDFIPEHHGTSTIDYFYYKSKQQESGIKSERIFKYPGPKPQSKETAIVMLVDSSEAASRVLADPNEDSIRDLVNRIARRKLEQGELDRCGLTIGELKKITDVLTHILKSSSHQRIAYPPKPKSPAKSAESEKAVPEPIRLLPRSDSGSSDSG